MENLLFLAHRIPYPPNKGDKIRSFHFLKYLSQHFNIYLGAFIDDPDDMAHIDKVKEYCVDVKLISINPKVRTLISAKGLLMGSSLSVPYYDLKDMHTWVARVIHQQQTTKVFVFSSVMSQFVMPFKNLEITADFVDIDSDKWRQYAEKKPWPISWVYKREAKRLFAYEKEVTNRVENVLFVSEAEANLFKTLSPETSNKIEYVNNGVDIDFFTPSQSLSNPYKEGEMVLVFTGAMDYWANEDAVVWFVEHVLPLVRGRQASVKFYIVGSNPSAQVEALQKYEGVVVTGRVEDMRPYLQYADVIVAPLRIARGIQNKILEAMAMSKPIVASSQAMEGINANLQGVKVIDEPEGYADAVLTLMETSECVPENRAFVKAAFSWAESGRKLVSFIE